MNTARRVVMATLAAMSIVVVASVGRVSAHAELLASDPAPGAVLDQSPKLIVLKFSEHVEISLGAIRLFDGTGSPVQIGEARHPAGHEEAVEVDLPQLANGSYVVDWRVVSADSHPVHAAFTFQVGPTSNLGNGVLGDVINGTHTGKPAAIALGVSRGLVIAAMAIVFGGLLVCGLGIVSFDRRQQVAILGAAGVGTVAGLLALPFEVGYASGRSLSVVTDWSAWRAVWHTTIGVAWVVRAAAIAVTAALLVPTRARSTATWWKLIVLVGLVVAGTASAYGGHGAAGRWHYLGVLLTMLHVSAMAVWLGGLAMVVLSLDRIDHRGVTRFSSIALLSVGAIVFTGTIQGVRQVGSLDALTGTSYGKLLIWKVVAVAAVLAVATVARRATHGRLGFTAAVAGASLSAATMEDTAIDGFDRPRLRRAVSIEAVLGVVVIVITSLLMAANPTKAISTGPFSSTLTSNGYLATVLVDPARVGDDDVHLYLGSPSSSLAQPDAVSVTIQDPSRSVDPIALELEKTGAGHYISSAATFPYAATWRMVITARYGFEEVTFTTDVPIN